MIKSAKVEYLEWLKNGFISPTTKNKNGSTPMMVAARKGYIEVVRYLAGEAKEDTLNQIHERNGSKPIHWAAQYGQFEVVQYLIEKCKVNPDEKCQNNKTRALYLAAKHQHLEVVQYLLKKGAKHDAKDDALLMDLVEDNSDLYLKWLEEKFISPTAKNKNGLTPMMVAEQRNYLGVMKHLIFKSIPKLKEEKSPREEYLHAVRECTTMTAHALKQELREFIQYTY